MYYAWQVVTFGRPTKWWSRYFLLPPAPSQTPILIQKKYNQKCFKVSYLKLIFISYKHQDLLLIFVNYVTKFFEVV